jgi:hypothetical protein
MAKKKSSWKKKLAKAALIGGALYGASKVGKGKSVADTAATEGIKWTPGPTIPDIHSGLKSNRWKYSPVDPGPTFAAKGGRIGAKKGGHVKSMGIAKRGGGVAKR